MCARPGFEVVAVNDVADAGTLAHLLAYDSTYGRLDRPVGIDDTSITVGGEIITVLSAREPEQLPWAALGVDVAIESTGRFRSRDDAA